MIVFVYFVDVCVFPRLFSSKIFFVSFFFPKKKQKQPTASPFAWEATRDHCQDLGIGCSGTFHGSIRQSAPGDPPIGWIASESFRGWGIWVFPKIGVPQKGWFIMENPIKMGDLGVPLFLETPISSLFWKLGWTIGTLGRWRWHGTYSHHPFRRKENDRFTKPPWLSWLCSMLIFRGVNKYQSNIPILEWWYIFLYTLPGSLAVCPWKVKKSQ